MWLPIGCPFDMLQLVHVDAELLWGCKQASSWGGGGSEGLSFFQGGGYSRVSGRGLLRVFGMEVLRV